MKFVALTLSIALCAASLNDAAAETISGNIQGMKVIVTLEGTTIEVRLMSGYKGLPAEEIERRIQLAVGGTYGVGCRLPVEGRVTRPLSVSGKPQCGFY